MLKYYAFGRIGVNYKVCVPLLLVVVFYAYLGALEWDSAETIKIIQSLLNRL
jgi:hypothetical protein